MKRNGYELIVHLPGNQARDSVRYDDVHHVTTEGGCLVIHLDDGLRLAIIAAHNWEGADLVAYA
jgi:hypothetical protein